MSSAEVKHQVEDATWQKMSELKDSFSFQAWLDLQCALIESAYSGLLVVEEDSQHTPLAVWGNTPTTSAKIDSLIELVEKVSTKDQGLVINLAKESGSKIHFGVAYPIQAENCSKMIVAVAIAVASKAELPAVLRSLQWGGSWLELQSCRALISTRAESFHTLTLGVDMLTQVLSEDNFDTAAMRLVSELAIAYNCDFVAIGFSDKHGVKMSHMSHSSESSSQMNLLKSIEAAMDESVDQRNAILFPDSTDQFQSLVTVAHGKLNQLNTPQSIVTIPLVVNEKWLGALLLSRNIDSPFQESDMSHCESVAGLAVNALEDKRQNDRSIFHKIGVSVKAQLVKVFGAGYVGLKIILLLASCLVILLSVLTVDYRLSTEATLRTINQRAITAPYDGYIKNVHVKAGDLVDKGKALISLDDQELVLERLRWQSQKNTLSRQYQKASASQNPSRITILSAQLSQADAQLDLVESKLKRSVLRAPISGLVVSGDLRQRLGGGVTLGESLFELSPIDAYRVKLLVKESRISDVKTGQAGVLYLSALPGQSFDFSVDNITVITESFDGASYFVVEGLLDESQNILRPGMEGVGKINIGERKLLSVWTRELREWFNLMAWRLWG